jgi:hypothetical protein
MNPAKLRIHSLDASRGSDLLQLELQVARRADKLWRMAGCRRGKDLTHWLQAEGEVLKRYFEVEEPKRRKMKAASPAGDARPGPNVASA